MEITERCIGHYIHFNCFLTTPEVEVAERSICHIKVLTRDAIGNQSWAASGAVTADYQSRSEAWRITLREDRAGVVWGSSPVQKALMFRVHSNEVWKWMYTWWSAQSLLEFLLTGLDYLHTKYHIICNVKWAIQRYSCHSRSYSGRRWTVSWILISGWRCSKGSRTRQD